jgi:prepilin-type N-terminal cleavage/methylation domain-containing protein
MLNQLRRKSDRGLSLVELVTVLTIVAVLVGIAIATLRGSQTGDYIDRGTQLIYDDLVLIRSRALSTNTDHRLMFLTSATWKVQAYDVATSGWADVGERHEMPTNTYLTSATFTNAGLNLQASPRGLFTFLNGATGSPYVTVTGLGATKTKSLYVFVGGAIEVKTP